MAEDTRWSDARQDYITSSLSYRQIADKYNLPFGSVSRHARQERWRELRKKCDKKVVDKTIEKLSKDEAKRRSNVLKTADILADEIRAAVNRAKAKGELSAREIKSFTSALRDIKEVQDFRRESDLREQDARIKKLERDAEPEQEVDKTISIEIEGLPEGWTV